MSEPINWPRLAKGLTLIGLGGFLLATTTGMLPWSFWLDAARFWPVLIVGLGIRIMFERSGAPWGTLLSPLLILGTLGWVAQGAHVEPAPREWTERVAERPQGAESFTLDARLTRSRLQLQARELPAGRLLEGRSGALHDHGRLEVRGEAQEPEVRLATRAAAGWALVSGPQERWDLGVTEALPLHLRLAGAMDATRADLRRARLAGAHLVGAFNDVELKLPPPEGIAVIRVSGAFNHVHLIVPAGTPVAVVRHGPSLVEGDVEPSELTGDKGYRVRIEGAPNHVVIDQG
jgi:hypothetical protein